MLRQKLGKILIFFLFFSFSCAKSKNLFILSQNQNLRIIEERGHRFCNSLLKNYEEKELVNNYDYWNCRLLIAQNSLINANDEFAVNYNNQINQLLQQIDLILKSLPESLIIISNKAVDKQHHNKCLKMGYKIYSENQEEIDDYFLCRKSLLENHNKIPPFLNGDYLEYQNKDYNINFVINERINKNIAEYQRQKEEYPNCIRFNLNSINFTNCTLAYDKSRICHGQIANKQQERLFEAKKDCQKQAYIEFPNSLIDEDEAKETKEQKANKTSDYYNKNSLASLGLSVKDFASKIEEEKEGKKEFPQSLEEINNYNGLYTKLEIGKLRSYYVNACQKQVDIEVKQYGEFLEIECSELTKFEVIGEDI